MRLEYYLDDGNNNIGRGGSGKDTFVFALLDWTDSQSVAAWRIQYQIMGDELTGNQRLSKLKWRRTFGSD